MKILILVPPLNKPGGVANYYNAIISNLPSGASYFTRGSRKETGKFQAVTNFILDYIKFVPRLLKNDIVLINTSFAKAGIIRDSLFCLLCRLFKKPYIIFFRGWEKNFEKKVAAGAFKSFFHTHF